MGKSRDAGALSTGGGGSVPQGYRSCGKMVGELR